MTAGPTPDDDIDKGPQFARAMVEVGLLAGLVVLLAATAVQLRRKEREPQETANGPAAAS